MGITVTIDDREVRRRLSALSKRMSDMTPVMEDVGSDLRARILLGLEESRNPWGAPWKPLKRRKGRPLRHTGVLMNSIGYKPTRNSVTVGPGVEYGIYHQFGTKRIPRRAFMPIKGPFESPRADLPQSWLSGIMDIIDDAIAEAL